MRPDNLQKSWKTGGLMYKTGMACTHRLINYKDTKTKCRLYCCFLEFITWRYSQSCWYFRPSLMNYCTSNLLFGSPPPSLPLSKIKVQYIKTVFGWEGIEGCWVVLETIFCRRLTLCFWLDAEPTVQNCYTTPNKYLGGEGAWQINTCRKVPYQVNFFKILTFGIALYQSNLSTPVPFESHDRLP